MTSLHRINIIRIVALLIQEGAKFDITASAYG
jgi:hypothetical protein